MSFYDERFPEKWALDAVRSIHWINEIVITRNQKESRNNPNTFARYAWDLSMSAKLSDERMEFDLWFLAMGGQLHSFVYRDPADHELEREVIGAGTGDQNVFQLTKTYAVGAAVYVRDILRPVVESASVWVNDVEQLTGWSLSRSSGELTFDVAPADSATVAVSCTFDVPVRFNQPTLDWKIADKNPSRGYIWVCPGLSLIEVFDFEVVDLESEPEPE